MKVKTVVLIFFVTFMMLFIYGMLFYGSVEQWGYI